MRAAVANQRRPRAVLSRVFLVMAVECAERRKVIKFITFKEGNQFLTRLFVNIPAGVRFEVEQSIFDTKNGITVLWCPTAMAVPLRARDLVPGVVMRMWRAIQIRRSRSRQAIIPM
jgi:hypothetical protein